MMGGEQPGRCYRRLRECQIGSALCFDGKSVKVRDKILHACDIGAMQHCEGRFVIEEKLGY